MRWTYVLGCVLSAAILTLAAVLPQHSTAAERGGAGYRLGDRLPQNAAPAKAASIKEINWDALMPADWKLRVYSVAKTVADCFKHRNKIGLDVALEALKDARAKKKASADDLWRFAKICRVANVMRPYLEVVE